MEFSPRYVPLPGSFKLIVEDQALGYGLFEHDSGGTQWILMSLMVPMEGSLQ